MSIDLYCVSNGCFIFFAHLIEDVKVQSCLINHKNGFMALKNPSQNVKLASLPLYAVATDSSFVIHHIFEPSLSSVVLTWNRNCFMVHSKFWKEKCLTYFFSKKGFSFFVDITVSFFIFVLIWKFQCFELHSQKNSYFKGRQSPQF